MLGDRFQIRDKTGKPVQVAAPPERPEQPAARSEKEEITSRTAASQPHKLERERKANSLIIDDASAIVGNIVRKPKFFQRIVADVQRRRQAFYSPKIETPAEEDPSKPKNWRQKMRAGFARAARVITHNAGTAAASNVLHAATHNRVTEAVANNRIVRIVAKPFRLIPPTLHYVRNPLGKPGEKQNTYTRATINMDFYAQALMGETFDSAKRFFGKGVGEVADLVHDSYEGRMQALKQKHYSLYAGIKTTNWLWNNLGQQTAGAAYRYLCTNKATNGDRYFSPLRIANNTTFWGAMWYVGVPVAYLVAAPAYYYGTWTTVNDVYFPNASIYMSQNFVNPNGAGQIIAARDEIFTGLGKIIHPDKKIEEVRFDMDFNSYFSFYEDSLRPDLAASKLNSQTAFGVKCDLEVTGIYSRMPRFIRLSLLRWLDLRPEIVHVVGGQCEQLTEMPEGFKKAPPSTLKPPEGFKPMSSLPGAPLKGAFNDQRLTPPTIDTAKFIDKALPNSSVLATNLQSIPYYRNTRIIATNSGLRLT